MQSNWKEEALCFNHPELSIWFSYKIEDVDRAKNICKKCPVRVECFMSMWNTGDFYGIHGGATEFEYLSMTWKEATNEKQSNRTRSDRVLKTIVQGLR